MPAVEVVDVLTDEVCLEHASEAVPRPGERIHADDGEYFVEDVVYHWGASDSGSPDVEVRVTLLAPQEDRG